MKKIIIPIALAMFIMTCNVAFVLAADDGAGTGIIRISPALPIMVISPADFTVDCQQQGVTVNDPHIFLAMTKECYDHLTGDVTLDWTGDGIADLTITSWNMEDDGGKVPPDTTSGAGYTVASLKSHLMTSEPIYWAFEPFLDDPITETPQEFTLTLPSTEPKMLVYALGKTGTSNDFDARVPPTQPGFVVPEPATILMMLAPFVGLAAYAVKRKKQ